MNHALVPVAAVMTTPVWALTPETPVNEALQFAQEHDIHHLPLVRRDEPVGFVCTCDLQELSLNLPVARVMHPPVTIDQQASCADAVQLMDRSKVGSLLVTGEHGVVGIVTREDLSDASAALASDDSWHCTCCGSLQHLRTPAQGGAPLCLDCLQRARPPIPEDELGGSG
ncbi:MAG TPA: CBS domain-containing protein [Polyangiaceae bacterium]|nr:CBS domain-containing protein [Polyangiaceae bacterium]